MYLVIYENDSYKCDHVDDVDAFFRAEGVRVGGLRSKLKKHGYWSDANDMNSVEKADGRTLRDIEWLP